MPNTRSRPRSAETNDSSTNQDQGANQNHQNPHTNGEDIMSQFMGAIQGFIQQQVQAQLNTQHAPKPATKTTDQAVELFRNYNVPRFTGRDGPLAVEEWFEELERIFAHINCTDEQKLACAIFQFKDDARKWWIGFYRLLGEEDRKVLSWKIFKEVVTEKYFSSSFREKKETEFFELKQGSMTIEEYERKFNELAQFSPHLVDTETKMIARFRKGLRTDIKGIMAPHVIDDFSDLVKRAEDVETALGISNPTPKPTNNFGKRKWEGNNQGKGNFQDRRNFQDKKQRFGGNSSTGPSGTKPQCQKCGKYHYGECMFGKGVCFYCHEPGHDAFHCPKAKNKAPEAQRNFGQDRRGGKEPEKKGNARIFTLAQKEATENNDTMTGTLLILGTSAVVLFDSGASHSFISAKFCRKRKINCELENLALNISIPSGECIRTDRVARGVVLNFGTRELEANLYCIKMHDFDIILGMDWLSQNHATIKCHEREVDF